MVRFVTNVLLTGLAIALLGILVLLSTAADEGVRRQADLNLRQLRETAACDRTRSAQRAQSAGRQRRATAFAR